LKYAALFSILTSFSLKPEADELGKATVSPPYRFKIQHSVQNLNGSIHFLVCVDSQVTCSHMDFYCRFSVYL